MFECVTAGVGGAAADGTGRRADVRGVEGLPDLELADQVVTARGLSTLAEVEAVGGVVEAVVVRIALVAEHDGGGRGGLVRSVQLGECVGVRRRAVGAGLGQEAVAKRVVDVAAGGEASEDWESSGDIEAEATLLWRATTRTP